MDPPQRWLRRLWGNIAGLLPSSCPSTWLQLGGVYGWASPMCKLSYVGSCEVFGNRLYGHVHAFVSGAGKQLPFHFHARRAGAHLMVFFPIRIMRAARDHLLRVEGALQQLIVPSANVHVAGSVPIANLPRKRVPAARDSPGIMKFQRKPKLMSFAQRSYTTFALAGNVASCLMVHAPLQYLWDNGYQSGMLVVSPGSYSLQRSIKLVGPFGYSIVSGFTTHGVVSGIMLQHLLSIVPLQHLHGVYVHCLVMTHQASFVWKANLLRCLRNPHLYFNLHNVPPELMLTMFREAAVRLPAKAAAFLRKRIDASCKVKYGFALTARPTLKVPFVANVDLVAAKRFLRWVLQQLPVHWSLIEWFIGRSHVVACKSVTAGSILFNHKRYAASLRAGSPPSCVCQGLPLPRATSGHVCCHGSHPAARMLFGDMVALNMKTALMPVDSVLLQRIQYGILQLHSSFVNKVLAHDVWRCYASESWAFQCARSMLLPGVDMDMRFSVEAAVALRRLLSSLVAAPMDRNAGGLHIMCPVELHARMNKMFWADAVHYEHLQQSEEHTLRDMRRSYCENGFNRHVPFLPGGVGQASLLPKHKDDSRMRPITDTTRVPARSMSRAVASVLMLLLTKYWSWASFNITATKELVGKVMEFGEHFAQFQGVKIFAFDVKNMYTELAHHDVDNALYQFLHLVRSRLRALRFHLHKRRKRPNACVGASPGSRLFYSLPFHVLHKFVLWELDNNVFWAGNVLLKQRVGISMGGSCSPVLAQILCTWCEYTWLSSLGADARFVRGVRFMDDSTLFVAEGHSHLVAGYQHGCFPPGCVLECDGAGVSCVHMLESVVFVHNGNRLGCVHRNKNQTSILTLHTQHILRYVHARAPTMSATKFHTACAVLTRMFYNTHGAQVGMLWGPVLAFACELFSLGYSLPFIQAVLRAVLGRCHTLPVPVKWIPLARLVLRMAMVAIDGFRDLAMPPDT